MHTDKAILVGYSGHAYVAAEVLLAVGIAPQAYTERDAKERNPYDLHYLGSEKEEAVLEIMRGFVYHISIGDNAIRASIGTFLKEKLFPAISAIHPSSVVSTLAELGSGVLACPRVVINALAQVGEGVILNTGCIVEHECVIGDYAHIAPGAVLCGGVHIGTQTLIGAGAVVLPGVQVGSHTIVGAGAVVTQNIGDYAIVKGNPARGL